MGFYFQIGTYSSVESGVKHQQKSKPNLQFHIKTNSEIFFVKSPDPI